MVTKIVLDLLIKQIYLFVKTSNLQSTYKIISFIEKNRDPAQELNNRDVNTKYIFIHLIISLTCFTIFSGRGRVI